ncbi:FtsW/RodA/SpoVE family cell cycle protein [Heyndrickxia acidicola]|uniref:FtsW/RodA/SpoVE family cell cycle protein n=1 Tax=Heyndrickxia acidicola TaxID=209389 RepID=A0ABU6ME51_9BACI|nr:FtsW/RodA/SpoVE family cell cycle protein [Heyndrickxia acidicola]MED1202311.1 FtsW/RodA/SpoVE family cell cycle protein [Heyndrickxia acidicola]
MDNRNKVLINYNIILVLLLLFLSSCVAIYFAQQTHQYTTNFVVRQILWYIVGVPIIIGVMQPDEEQWRNITWIFYGVCIFLLILLIVAPASIAPVRNGAKCWFVLPAIGSIQPSEFMKVGLILTLSKLIYDHNAKHLHKTLKTDILLIGKLSIATFIPIALIMKQPDLGTALVMMFLYFVMLLVSGISWKLLVPVITATAGIGTLVIYLVLADPLLLQKYLHVSTYQFDRINSWLRPQEYAKTLAYNYLQTVRAIGSGMMSGHFHSGSKVYIPEKQSDFIFSAIGENFGFIGSSFVICLFMSLVFNIILVGLKTKDAYSSYICAGIIGVIVFHVFENVGMDIGILPITGIPLPFISYGGSSLLSNMFAIGLVLNISSRNRSFFFD